MTTIGVQNYSNRLQDGHSTGPVDSQEILGGVPNTEPPRFLSRDVVQQLIAQIRGGVVDGEHIHVNLNSNWRSDVSWERNRVGMSSEWRNLFVYIHRDGTQATMNQVDPVSLQSTVAWIERIRREFGRGVVLNDVQLPPEKLIYPDTHIWSNTTYAMTDDERSEIANQLIVHANTAGMLSAGYLSVTARASSVTTEDGRVLYAPQTLAECSMTVRDPSGTGSGWAGASSYDWNRFDAKKLAEIALDKCLRSRNPVAVEPGRYTTILEPQATADLMGVLYQQLQDLPMVEQSVLRTFHEGKQRVNVSKWGPPAVIGTTKIGERVMDERITIDFDPLNPDMGVLPWSSDGEPDPVAPFTWVKSGILTGLTYSRRFALQSLGEPDGKPNPNAFRMSGGTDSIDDMIATTKRGLIVTRFWNVDIIDGVSLLCTGFTRDGLWLIENGKISHPVKNFRFVESPLFAFNQVEQLGVPVPVYSPKFPIIVPPVKVRDFSFTALIDAI